MVKVGDKIRIVDDVKACCNYKAGDEFTVTEVGVYAVRVKENDWLIVHSAYEVCRGKAVPAEIAKVLDSANGYTAGVIVRRYQTYKEGVNLESKLYRLFDAGYTPETIMTTLAEGYHVEREKTPEEKVQERYDRAKDQESHFRGSGNHQLGEYFGGKAAGIKQTAEELGIKIRGARTC